MAVEDIPPKKPRGLGTRLEQILASTSTYRPEAAESLYGGAPVETTTEAGGAGTGTTKEEEALPPPSEVIIVDQAYGITPVKYGPRAGLTYLRPDLDPSAYNQGSSKSTRVWGIQWIPTLGGKNVYGDILVAFARPSKNQEHTLYVYKNNSMNAWESFRKASSLGSRIGLLTAGRPYQDGDGNIYIEKHPTFPDKSWIFSESYMAMWSTARPVSTSGTALSVGAIAETLREAGFE